MDGLIVEGRTEVDESMLTGEPFPAAREPGDPVAAGTVSRVAPFLLRATRVGSETTLARIARLVEEAQGGKAPMQELGRPGRRALRARGDRDRGRRGAGVAARRARAAGALRAHGLRLGLDRGLSLRDGARHADRDPRRNGRRRAPRDLIRGGEALERAGALTTVVFDKTGTLTRGRSRWWRERSRPRGRAVPPARRRGRGRGGSEHPLARAVARHAAAQGVTPPRARDVRVTRVAAWRGSSKASRRASARSRSPPAGPSLRPSWRPAPKRRRSRAAPWRGSARAASRGPAARALRGRRSPARRRRRGGGDAEEARASSVLATGDREAPARTLAQAVGVDEVRAGLQPEGKVALVRELQSRGETVAMVGDGLNDAPALAAADLGIALGTGTDAAMEAADVTLVRGSMDGIVAALDLSRRTRSTVRQNLFWAFAYNVIAIPVAAGALYPAAGILLHPTVASAAMALSSVSVVTNSLRLAGWRGGAAYGSFER